LLIGGWQAKQSTLEGNILPLVRALQSYGAEKVKKVILNDNHSFKNKRTELVSTVISWLQDNHPEKKKQRIESRTRELLRKYMEASNNHDYKTFRKWVREERPEEWSEFIDPDGNLIFTNESGIIMTRLAKEWSAIQAIKQIHEISAKAKTDGDVAAFIDLLAEDGIYMWPGVPAIVGREALEVWFKKRFSEFSPEVDKTIEEMVVTGNWAFERGNEVVKITNRSSGEVQVIRGKYINMFQKQTDGSWKIARRIRNLDHPPVLK
jgi:ketosteroid isomerase-like protein